MIRRLSIALALTLSVAVITLSYGVSAGQVANLYQADVAADGTTEQWQQRALAQVLARVSGNAQISTVAEIATELKRASGYIKQFEAVRHSDGNRMRVLLDAVKVNQLLQQNNIPVWGAMRPDILVWLVQQNEAERSFVRSAQQPLNLALQQAFTLSALPLLQPLYDMDDVLSLSETDVWAGFWQQINQASRRYSADVVVAATVEQITDNAESTLRLSWQRQTEGKTYREELTAPDEESLMLAFAAALANQLAQQYASVMSAEGGAAVRLKVQQLNNLTDIVQVQRLLQQVVGVTEVTIAEFEAGTAYYQLRSDIAAEGLLNALRFNPQLQLYASDTPTAAQQAVDLSSMPVLATFNYSRL